MTFEMPSNRRAGAGRVCGRLLRGAAAAARREPLLALTLVGVVLGLGVGIMLSELDAPAALVDVIGFPGDIFIRLLKMLVLPLIAGSMVSGVCSLGRRSADKGANGVGAAGGFGVGGLAGRAVGIYLLTMVLAVATGIIFVTIIRPGHAAAGVGVDGGCGISGVNATDAPPAASPVEAAPIDGAANATLLLPPPPPLPPPPKAPVQKLSPAEAIRKVLLDMAPPNILAAAVDMNIIGIICFSVFFGAALCSLGDEAAGLIALVGEFNAAVTKMVGWVLWLSPVGIFSMICGTVGSSCNLGAIVAALGSYILCFALALGVHSLVTLPAVLYALTRGTRSPILVARTFVPAFVTAFGTDSSSATLPVTMRCAEEFGCGRDLTQFILPMGATGTCACMGSSPADPAHSHQI